MHYVIGLSVRVCVRMSVRARAEALPFRLPSTSSCILDNTFSNVSKTFFWKILCRGCMGLVGRVPSNLRELGDQVYLVPSNVSDLPSFLLVSTLCSGRQMYIVDRMTKFKLTIAETMSGDAAPEQSGGS